MGGSSKQTVGFKYFAGMQVVIGNCIEQILNINPDSRGWLFNKPIEIEQLREGDTSIVVNQPNLFGGDKQEGGWVGAIDIHTGREEKLRQNEYLAKNDSELVSSFPGLSYLVYRGITPDQGFQLVSMSGMLKEVLYWPKRTRIKNDGKEQWYKQRQDGAVVCEIDAFQGGENSNISPFNISESVVWSRTGDSGSDNQSIDIDLESPDKKYYSKINQPISAGLNTPAEYKYNVVSPPNIVLDVCFKIAVNSLKKSIIFSGLDIYNVSRVEDGESIFDIYYCRFVSGFTVEITVTGNPSNYLQSINDIFYFNPQTGGLTTIHAKDINPIHKIREVLTDDTAMNKPESSVNDENFRSAADRIWLEGLGISWAITEKSCKEAIDELLYHIEGGIRLNRQTGKYEIILFRDDLLDLNNAILFDKASIKTFNMEVANIEDVINSVNINYYDRENIKNTSFSLDEIGSIISSELNTQTLDFPYFMRRKNAELVGNWKLKQLSTPTRKGTFTTGKYEARKINKYDVVKLTWQNQNMFEVPVRIMKIGLGDGRDNTVTLDWVEVIPYSSTVFPAINVDPPTSVVLPPQPNQSVAFEMPYFEAVQRFGQTQVDAELANNPDLGYLVVATKKPQSNSINALLYTDDGTGYQQASIVDYCPVATLDQEISYLDASFSVKNIASISQAEVGTLILCDEELMVYQSYDASTKILTVKRAALDTVPKPHSQDAVFYFYDAFNAFDAEQYVLGETVKAKVLTTTPSGILGMEEAPVLTLDMNARPNRPYPPANVQLNYQYYPKEIEGELVLTWVSRNRLQQTGGSILGWMDNGVNAEDGTTYEVKIKDSNQNIVFENHTAVSGINIPDETLIPEEEYTVEIRSKRDGYYCFQPFIYTFKKKGEFVPINVFVGCDSAEKNDSNVLTINISHNTETEYLCAVIAARADSVLSIPSGWELLKSEVVMANNLLSSVKYWVLGKVYADETAANFEFDNIASQGVIVSLKARVVNSVSSLKSNTLSSLKLNRRNSILGITLGNRFEASTDNMTIVRAMAGFSQCGDSMYQAANLVYHGVFVFSKITDMSASINIETDSLLNYNSETTKSIIALEVEQPS